MAGDDRPPARRALRAADEVELTAGRAILPPAHALRIARAVEIDLERGVDRQHLRVARDHRRIVYIIDRMGLDPIIAIEEVVKRAIAHSEGEDAAARMNRLAAVIDDAAAHELGQAGVINSVWTPR